MKILIITENFKTGGLETQIMGFCRYLRNSGHEVYLISGIGSRTLPLKEIIGDHILEVDMRPDLPTKEAVEKITELASFIQKIDPDFVHLHPFTSIIYGGIAASLANKPYVVTLHGPLSLTYGYNAAYRFYIDLILKDARHVFCVSEEVAQRTKDIIPECKINTLPNGVDTESFRPSRRNPAGPVALIARLDSDKVAGIKSFLMEWSKLPSKMRKQVHIFGEGNSIEKLKEWVKVTLNGGRWITFMGHEDHLEERLKTGYSMIAGMGRVVLEAGAMNLPVLLVGYKGPNGLVNRDNCDRFFYRNFSGRYEPIIGIEEIKEELQSLETSPGQFFLRSWVLENADEKNIFVKYLEEAKNIEPLGYRWGEAVLSSIGEAEDISLFGDKVFHCLLNNLPQNQSNYHWVNLYLTGKLNQIIAEKDNFWNQLNQTITEKNALANQLTQTTAEKDNLWDQLNQTIAEKDNIRNQLNESIAEKGNFWDQLNRIYSSDFWKVASWYYRMRNKSILVRSIYVAAKWLKRKIKNDPYRSTLTMAPKDVTLGPSSISLEIETVKLPPGAVEGNTYDIFFFPMIDFSFRYQRPQQLASYFAQRNHRVFYMNISEFLPPNAKEDFKINKIRQNLYEVFLRGPYSLDTYGGKMDSEAVRYLYLSLSSLRKQYGIITAISIVHNPYWSPLAFKMREDHGWKIVYDCLDDWDRDMFKGIGQSLIEEEKNLAKNADLLTVTAELLYKKWYPQNNTCVLVRNACDYEHFIKAASNILLVGVKKPIIGFLGGIAEWIDIDILHYAATLRKDWSFVFLGGIFTDLSKIEKLPNVHLLGNKPYKDMPNYLMNFDVCLIPFKKNRVTEAVDPVKLYEYFSLGKPVVARDLSEIRHYKEYLYLFNTEEEFVECIEKALHEQDNIIREERRKIAASNTWDERVNIIHGKIKSLYPKSSIIVTTYNNLKYNMLCIESILLKTDYPNYEIIITDNNSTDGTKDYLIAIEKKFHNIKVILNDENEGFAKATNKGIRMAKGEYIVLLNNDTVVTKGWLTKFVNYLGKYPDIGLIGPVANFCGNEAKISVTYKGLSDMDPFAYNYTNAHSGEFFDIKILALFCTAMRREIIEQVGLLDESFGIGMFEDDDYSHRVKLKEYRVVCAEDIFIHHFGQVAFKKLIETGEYYDLFEKNRKRFEEKWAIKWEPHRYRQ